MFLTIVVVLLGWGSDAQAFSGKRPEPVEDSFAAQFEASLPGPAASPTHGERRLRVVTYNIHGVPLPGIDHTRYRKIGQMLASQRAAGTAPQVVVLQEAFHAATAELTREAGYPHVAVGPPGAGTRYNAGLLVLSEYEILQTSWAVFSRCVSWDCLSRKGILHARLNVPGLPQALELYTTHMNSDPDMDFWTDPEETLGIRLTQLGEAREFIWDTARSQAPLIFAGDLNFHPEHDDYLVFAGGAGYRNSAETCARSGACEWPEGQDPLRDWRSSPDHQFYQGGRSPRVDLEPARFEKTFREPVHNGAKFSDHDGLQIDYRVTW